MQFRLANRQDTPALLQLWQQVFGDDIPFIQRCLAEFSGPSYVFVAQEAWQEIAAQLLAVPCAIGTCKGFYLYALATRPAARGQGVMSRLMQTAEESLHRAGAAFCALVPANRPLFAFYGWRGYTFEAHLFHWHYHKNAAEGETGSLPQTAQLPPQEYTRLRQRFAPVPFVEFDILRTGFVLQDFYAQDGEIAYCGQGYALFLPQAGGVLVPEIFAKTPAAEQSLLQAICKKTAQSILTVAAGPPGLPTAFQKEPFALFKPFAGAGLPQNLYLRMALEEFGAQAK